MTPAHRWKTAIAVALLAGFSASACASSGGDPDTDPRPDDDREDLEELEAIYQARADSARASVSEADVHFMTGMIGHHAQALVMSELAPDNRASAQIQVLAARIINAQKDEIATMQGWLRARGRPVPEVHIQGTTLTIDGPQHAMGMPGMLTDAQMRDLAQARGAAFDRLYLTYMIQHHEGAVTMVHELFATDGAAQDDLTFKLASDIQVDQLTEIARMESMLEALPAAGGLP